MVSSVRGRLLKSKEMTFKKRKGVSSVNCAERADICGLYISFISSLIPLMTTNWRLIFFFIQAHCLISFITLLFFKQCRERIKGKGRI